VSFREIGSKIQQAREARGLSQRQLARMVGCSQSALSNWEKGKRRLYLPQLQQLAQALEMPVDYFMEVKQQENIIIPANRDNQIFVKLINEISLLSYEEQQDVLKYIAFIRWSRIKGGGR
jgi:transcriptional regulator with XRE-family HTH domain